MGVRRRRRAARRIGAAPRAARRRLPLRARRTASPICRCARWPPRSAAARACCCSCSAARTAWSQALLARARADELAVLDRVRRAGAAGGPSAAAEAIWALARRTGAPRAADALAGGLRPRTRRARRGVGGLRRPDRRRLARAPRRAGPGGRRRRPHAAAGRAAGLPARPARHRRRRAHRRRGQRYLRLLDQGPDAGSVSRAAPRANRQTARSCRCPSVAWIR